MDIYFGNWRENSNCINLIEALAEFKVYLWPLKTCCFMTVPTRLEIKLFGAKITFMNFFLQVFFASNFMTFGTE
jgi:hypothetical protein